MGLAFITTATSTSNATSYDFGNFSAATAGKMVVGCGGSGAASNVASVSIGGTNGALHIAPTGAAGATGIASRTVGSGNNNVTVVFNTGIQRAFCSVWLLTSGADSPSDTDGLNSQTSSTTSTIVLDLPANSVAVYVGIKNSGTSASWSAATERLDTTLESTPVVTAADKVNAGAAAPGDIETITFVVSGTRDTGVSGAVWPLNTALTPARVDETDTFYTPVAAQAAVNLTPSRLSEADSFYTPVVTVGAVGLAPTLFTETDTFYVPIVSFEGSLQPARFDETDEFYAPTIALFLQPLQATRFDEGDTIYHPVIPYGHRLLSWAIYY